MPASEYQPQLATLVDEAPEGDQWLHELKYDGYRISCRVRNGAVALYSRNGKDWTASFPEIVDAAKALRVSDALIDGEVAMVLPDGRTSFQTLQNALKGTNRAALTYFVFDLLRVSGKSIERLPLEGAERTAADARRAAEAEEPHPLLGACLRQWRGVLPAGVPQQARRHHFQAA